EPARRCRRPVEAIAIEPETPSRLILDTVIVAQLRRCRRSPPPFSADAFRSVGPPHAVLQTAPAEEERRIVGYRRHRLDRFGPQQKADRPRPVGAPGSFSRRESRNETLGAFGNMAFVRRKPADRKQSQAIGQSIDKSCQLFGPGAVAIPALRRQQRMGKLPRHGFIGKGSELAALRRSPFSAAFDSTLVPLSRRKLHAELRR